MGLPQLFVIMIMTFLQDINLRNNNFPGQSMTSVWSDATSERSQEMGNGDTLWSAEPPVNGHSLSLSAHQNGFLKGDVSPKTEFFVMIKKSFYLIILKTLRSQYINIMILKLYQN